MKVYVSIIVSVLFSVAFRTKAQSQSPRLLPFQGRLSDANGKPILEGVRVVQFQIYSEPIEGKVLWPGEVHRVTVNGGLVNVVLGSKNPLPRDRSDQTDRSFFDQPLYLQITVDANGDGKISDDKVDPPMLPRQTILPVLFAQESASSRDSQKLAGFDWSAILVGGNNNPSSGQISASRIQSSGITAAQLATNSIQTSNVGDGQITLDKLAPRVIGTSRADVGGIAFSESTGDLVYDSVTAKEIPVEKLSVTLITSGRPVLVFLSSGEPNLGGISDDGVSLIYVANSGLEASVDVNIYRSSKLVSKLVSRNRLSWGMGANATGLSYVFESPPSSIQFVDNPPKGSNSYSVTIHGVSRSVRFRNVRLVAFEL